MLMCGKAGYSLPIKPSENKSAQPDPGLVSLIEEARQLQTFMLSNRHMSVPELARAKRIGPNTFARTLRLNYLAPDIQASIYDGVQPASLTRHKLLFGAMPLDWDQKRQLFGFG